MKLRTARNMVQNDVKVAVPRARHTRVHSREASTSTPEVQALVPPPATRCDRQRQAYRPPGGRRRADRSHAAIQPQHPQRMHAVHAVLPEGEKKSAAAPTSLTWLTSENVMAGLSGEAAVALSFRW